MASFIQGDQLRRLLFGHRITATTYSLVTETHTLFTVAGGDVLITSIVGKVTTDITVANTVKLQANPTTGTTQDLCAATDIGTTDTLTGARLSFQGLSGDSLLTKVGAVQTLKAPIVVAAGTIEQVTTGTNPDGAIQWILTYVPLDTNASVTAA
jgi:hypothetical protein